MAAGLILAVAAGAVSFLVAWLIYRNATRLGVVQDPNERSSHTRPTPSGGGIGIVLGGTLGSVYAIWNLSGSAFVVATLALAMGIVGFVDDRRHLPAIIRLIVQITLVGIMVWTLEPQTLGSLVTGIAIPFPMSMLAAVVIALVAVYWVNVFNFMDGIDGLAAAQATFMVCSCVFIGFSQALAGQSATFLWVVAVGAAAFGFLLLNWPPAKIFMGDAGSTYLGFMIAYLALATISLGWLDIFQWAILAALFVTDATITLVRRALRGERLMQAHRLHAYQHLARRWQSHQPVTILYSAINILWLLPLAWAAGIYAGSGPVALAAAYLPLAILLALAGAGRSEPEITPSSS